MFRFLKDFLFEEDLVPVADPRTGSIESIGANATKVDAIADEKPAGGELKPFVSPGISLDSFADDSPATETAKPADGLVLDIAAPSKSEEEVDVPLAGDDVELGDLSKASAITIPVETEKEPEPFTIVEPEPVKTPEPAPPVTPEPVKAPEPAPEVATTPEPAPQRTFSVDTPTMPATTPTFESSSSMSKDEEDEGATEEDLTDMRKNAEEILENNRKEAEEIKQDIEKLNLQLASLDKSTSRITKDILPEIERLEAARKMRLENAAKLHEEAKQEEEKEAKIKEELSKIETIDKLAA